MKKLLRIVGTTFLLSLAGCATQTPYQASGARGGYKEEQINANTYRISFDGNGLTKRDVVWNYWLYRCAESTRQKGYDILDEIPDPLKKTTAVDRGSTMVPTVSYGNDGAVMLPTVAYGNDRAVMVKTRGGGGGGGHSVGVVGGGYYTVTTYHSSGIIQMYHDSDTFYSKTALRAQPIIDALKPYVDSGGKIAAPSRADIFKNAMVVPPKSSGV